MTISFPDFLRASATVSRAITAENPTGSPGNGGRGASRLGEGRKARPCIDIPAGTTVPIASISGPGVIRHIWFTLASRTEKEPFVLRNLILRITWDHASTPAIEVPLGDFFGAGFGTATPYSSQVMTVAPNTGLNSFLMMPFRKHALIEIVSEHSEELSGFFYQVDYTLGDTLNDDVMYLHTQWRRTNGDNELGQDHVIADITNSSGSYVGTQVFLTQLERFWYGEGEVKFFIDEDVELPTINGTGLEDYVGGAWAFQDRMGGEKSPQPLTFDSPYCGYHQFLIADDSGVSPYARHMPPSHGMYRWHLLDPVRFQSRLLVTLQQIGDRGGHLFERRDDITTVAYWYQPSPEGSSYQLPAKEARRPR